MLRNAVWVLALAVATNGALVLNGGCSRAKPRPAPTPPITPAAAVTSPETHAGTPSTDEPAISGEPEKPDEQPASPDSDQAVPAPALNAPTFAVERLVLLAPGNPIIVELQLSIDGQPHTAALERLVDEVLKIADADGDGRTMWKELCECKRVKYGQYGNLAIDNENSEKQVVDRYDIARDGVVDRSELPRFLTRNAGGSRPFSIRGTLDHRDFNRGGAPTWRVIDADGDGVITASERAAAHGRLSGRDNDDDEILLVSDLNPRLLVPDPEMMAENRRRRGPDAARVLGPHADWNAVQRSLELEYGGGRMLRADSFPLTPELFTQLDKNNDGRIKRDEFPGLNEAPPQVVIRAEFGPGSPHAPREDNSSPDDSNPPNELRPNQPRLSLIYIAPALAGSGSSAVEQPGRLTFVVGGALLTIYTNDTVASDDFSVRAKQALDMFDQDKNGYLEKSEVPESLQGQLGRFEAVDADDDGKAYPHEIEAFLAQQQAGLRAQIHAKAGDSEDALFAALDTDHDERLDSRELEGIADRLADLDKNGDGQLTADELPEVLLIGLARGSLENVDATFAPPPVIARGPDGKAPRWFTAMDANRDGAISRREFLGSAERFAQLDKDGNGLLDVTEVVAKSDTQ